MLYDPKWQRPAQPTVDDLILWLETQPADKTYEWFNLSRCLLCQYLDARGFPHRGNYWHIAQKLGMEDVAGTEPYTFGAALERARSSRM